MVRKFKQLVEEQDSLVLSEHLGSGSFGTAYKTELIRKNKRIRYLATKLFTLQGVRTSNQTREFISKIIPGYVEWISKIPSLQSQHPRLIFNNQQVVPIEKIDSTLHNETTNGKVYSNYAIVSEIFKHRTPMQDPQFKVAGALLALNDLNEVERFVLEQLKEGIPIHRDMLDIVKVGKEFRVTVRDPDLPALNLVTKNALHTHLLAAMTLNNIIKFKAMHKDSRVPKQVHVDAICEKLRKEFPTYAEKMIVVTTAKNPKLAKATIIGQSKE